LTLAALALWSCAAPGITPPVSEPSSTVSRIRVVNDSPEELRDLRLVFPHEEVVIGDVAPGAASGYVDVAQGVYNYSAFRFQRGGESVVQPVIDFVGELPLPLDEYTYLLGVEPDRGEQLELLTVFRSRPVAGDSGRGAVWVRVSNQGPDDLGGYTMVFPDQEIYFGSVPAGAISQYTRLYTTGPHQLVRVQYTADGKAVAEGEPADDVGPSTGISEAKGTYTYVVASPGCRWSGRLMRCSSRAATCSTCATGCASPGWRTCWRRWTTPCGWG
jgi:hypothetical protein